jgi:hypothetical protein
VRRRLSVCGLLLSVILILSTSSIGENTTVQARSGGCRCNGTAVAFDPFDTIEGATPYAATTFTSDQWDCADLCQAGMIYTGSNLCNTHGDDGYVHLYWGWAYSESGLVGGHFNRATVVPTSNARPAM